MDIKQNICPKCGRPTEEGFCGNCRVEETEWMICQPRVQCTHCPTCGSLKTGSMWSDTNLQREDLIEEQAMSGVKIHEDVEDYIVSLSHYDPSPNRTMVRVDIAGTLYGIHVEQSCNILIVWIKEQCDRCSRLSGSYYAGIIQVRAEGRKPDEWEKERALEIAANLEESFQMNGDRLSFITKSEENKDGVDIVISSHSIGESISKEIKDRLGGKYTRHPKLIGEKKGKPVYRITYLVRLPRFRRGDILEMNRGYFEVRSNESGNMRLFDLRNGEIKYVNENEPARHIGNILDSETSFVAYTENDTFGMLDPKTYENIECLTKPWLNISEGSEIRFIRDRDNDTIILLG
ncbi:MAG: 60S ribosomal export protein NMD3 [Methanomicrobiaceae archaeon]|nr:60S ribosomal export protein NMD3 [Methanomicrobiaceae archaeon]